MLIPIARKTFLLWRGTTGGERRMMEPVMTLDDGSQLLISTQRSVWGQFTCGLYLSKGSDHGGPCAWTAIASFRAASCREAQTAAYDHARHLYSASVLKEPPYAIRAEPNVSRKTDFQQRTAKP
jgi:hypothetical protein